MTEEVAEAGRVEFTSDIEVSLLQHMGGDHTVIGSARVSTQGSESLSAMDTDPAEAEGLIKFLMKNRHGTPFEHNSFTFYVKAPIFVFREFHRHRIGWSYNEMSGRYTQLKPCFYVPFEGRDAVRVEGTKTGQYRYEPDDGVLAAFSNPLMSSCVFAWEDYENALGRGVVNEVARMGLPVNIMSEMWATANARSIMAFLSLRTEREAGTAYSHDPIAAVDFGSYVSQGSGDWAMAPSRPMKEIQMVADQIESQFAEVMPITYGAWNQFGRVAP